MASQELSLIIKAQNLAGQEFDKLKAGLASVEQQTKKSEAAAKLFSEQEQRAAQAMGAAHDQAIKMAAAMSLGKDATQRAAMQMEAMHEEALRMNASLQGTSDKAQQLQQTFGALTSTASTTASAFGLQIPALGAIGQASGVASLGLNTLSKTMVGFNAASAGVVGAGLAIGGAIGTMLREVDFVAKSFDDGIGAIWNFAKGVDALPPKLSGTEQAALNAAVAVKKFNSELAVLGRAAADLSGPYANVAAEIRRGQDEIDKTSAALEKNAQKWKQNAQAAIQAEKEKAAASKKEWADLMAYWLAIDKSMAEAQKKSFEEYDRQNKENLANLAKAQAAKKKAADEEMTWAEKKAALMRALGEDELKREEDAVRKKLELYANISDSLDVLMQGYLALGGSASDAFGSIIGLGQSALGVMGQLASGNIWGAINTGISGLIGFIGNIFGKGKKEAAEAKKMLEDFINGSGGIEDLIDAADRAGISLDSLFDAKKPKEMEKAIADVQAQLDLFDDAWARVDDAAKEYGLTIDDMTAGSAAMAREMDKQFEQLFGDWQLLIAAGYEETAVLEGMADKVNEFIQQAIRTGTEVPEAMRPMLEAMLQQGLLTDAAGNKLVNLEGINFAESITDGVNRIVAAVESMVDALLRSIGGVNGLNSAFGSLFGTVKGNTGQVDPGNYPGKGNVPLSAGGEWLPYRPGGYLRVAGEAGNEAILNEPQIQKLVMQGVAAAMAANGGSYQGGRQTIVLQVGSREISKVVLNDGTRRRQGRVNAGGIRGRV